MKTINYLGIDAGKKTLQRDTAQGALSRANQAKILKVWLQQLPAHNHLVLEASGGYEQNLVTLAHAAQIPVSVVNPARVRAFAKARGQRAKTDAIDAAMIRQFALAMAPAPTLPPSPVRRRAPFPKDSGQKRGLRFVQGGRAQLRRGLYMVATLSAIRQKSSPLAGFYHRLRQNGKPGKVALIACARKLTTHLNSILKSPLPLTA